jgi:NADH:ubiquinone oxidoreductase subunit K
VNSIAQEIPLEHFVALSSVLFSIGVYGVLTRRNAVLVLMSVELMLNAVSINMVAFAVYTAPTLFVGIIFAIFVITIAAAEVGLALAEILRVYRNRGTANIDEVDTLRW